MSCRSRAQRQEPPPSQSFDQLFPQAKTLRSRGPTRKLHLGDKAWPVTLPALYLSSNAGRASFPSPNLSLAETGCRSTIAMDSQLWLNLPLISAEKE